MTEDDAKAWIDARYGSDLTAKLARFVALLGDETSRQNLVSASSMDAVWVRHVVDSAQLVPFATQAGLWMDIGTGAGFPGIVAALLTDREMVLVEPRRRRVEFLRRVIYELDLGRRVTVEQAKAEAITRHAAIISARAVSTVPTLIASASHCANYETQWLLPKGRHSSEEVAQARKAWHGTFHVEQSVTDPDSMIVIASGISRR